MKLNESAPFPPVNWSRSTRMCGVRGEPLNLLFYRVVGETGVEPAWLAPRDFKSLVYTNSTTRPESVPR